MADGFIDVIAGGDSADANGDDTTGLFARLTRRRVGGWGGSAPHAHSHPRLDVRRGRNAWYAYACRRDDALAAANFNLCVGRRRGDERTCMANDGAAAGVAR